MDPPKPFQPEITATLVTLEAKNMPLNPLRNGDFRLKTTLSSDHFGPIEHLAGPPSPNVDVPHVPPGPIDPSKPFQPEITATLVTLDAKNVPLNPTH